MSQTRVDSGAEAEERTAKDVARQWPWEAETADLWRRLEAAEPFFLLSGPCVIESVEHTMTMAAALKKLATELGLTLVFKASFDKANRTSHTSYRGPGLEAGLAVLSRVKTELGLPVVTDFHEPWQAAVLAPVVDILQIPAFLCRQTDLLLAAGATGRIVNIKKGQFASPAILEAAVAKVRSTGNSRILVCERGFAFGYSDLVVDPRSYVRLRASGAPVVADVTHSVQQPAGRNNGTASGGLAEFIPTIARTAVAVGVRGLFFETHDNPSVALSDGPNQWPLSDFSPLLEELIGIARASRGLPRNSSSSQ